MADVGPVSTLTARTPVMLSGDRLYIDDGAGGDFSMALAVLQASLTKVGVLTVTQPATGSTLTIVDGKTVVFSKTLSFTGTDSTVMTFPTTSATIARTDAANTFTGIQTFSTPIATTSVATMSATVGGGVPTPPNNTTTFLRGDGTFAASGLTIGTTTITSGTTTRILYNNAGVVGEYTLTGSGTIVAMQTSPTFVTPVLGVAAGTSLALGGATIGTDALGVTGTTTFNGNVTHNAAAITLSGNISTAAWTTAGLRHKGVAFSATDTSSSGTVAAAYTNLFGVGTILASSATTYTNYFNTYFQDPVASTNVTMTNKWALGADSLKVSGVGVFTSAVTVANGSVSTAGLNFATAAGTGILALNSTFIGVTLNGTGRVAFSQANVTGAGNAGQVIVDSAGSFAFSASTYDAGADLAISRLAAANLRIGKAPSATPIAQKLTIGEPSRSGTDTNIGGSNGTVQSALGTGTGAASTLIFQTPILVASGTGAQTYATQLTLGLSAVFGSAAIATNATDGFVYIPTCAGTPTGVPTTNTGRVAMVYDTTNHQFWIYDAAWLQPKTPAAAATVTWQ